MRIILKILVVLSFIFRLSAQIPPPTMTVTDSEGKSQYLNLDKLDIDVRIHGFLAETRMTMTFYNSFDREITGNLYFPLPEGATVSGYALDINGRMVDGVVVERQKGRMVFEEIVRQGVDPGLVEWVEGNIFKTRVYPILPKGRRTVMVRYISELIYKNGKDNFFLPLSYDKKVNDFILRIEVIKAEIEPEIEKKGLADLRFTRWRDRYVAETTLKNVKLEEDLVLTLPVLMRQKVYVEKDEHDDIYFCLQDIIDKPKNQRAQIPSSPSRITILWDASSSMGQSGHDRELNILRSYFKGFPQKEISVDLVYFRNTKEEPIKFQIVSGNTKELIKRIQESVYDGGTQLGVLSPTDKEKKVDFYMLFTDGLSNFGREETTGWDAPLYIFSSSAWANHNLLRFMANQSGGLYFNLNTLDDQHVIQSIGKPVYSFISADMQKNSITENFPKTAQLEQERFVLTGKLLEKKAKITLNYGLRGKVLKQVKIDVESDSAVEGSLLRIFWAQKKIENLLIHKKRNTSELIDIGGKYGLVTPGTSMIVLDDLEQYLQYGIRPPESLPDMQREYDSYMKNEKIEDKQDDKLEYVANLWKERIKWWEEDFSDRKVRLKEKMKLEDRERSQEYIHTDLELENELRTLMDRNEQAIGGIVATEDEFPLPGVTVTLSNRNTEASFSTITNEKGIYIFSDVTPGNYNLTAELEGFNKVNIQRISFRRGDKLRFPITLGYSSLQEEIAVISPVADAGIEGGIEGGVEGGVVMAVTGSGGIAGVTGLDINAADAPRKGPAISLKRWSPDMPYLKELAKADANEVFKVYLNLKKTYGQSPSFFLDCADFFFKKGMKDTGLQVLSNIAEIELESAALLRILAHRLRQLNYLDLSCLIFEEVLRMRPEEPQSYRDLALVLDQLNQPKKAIDLLYQMVLKWWDDRFPEIEVIALMEINNLLARIDNPDLKELNIDPRFIKLLDVDIRIVLTWDADMTDIDLWIVEPSGERAYYEYQRTESGGLVSEDFTEGYGPEEYCMKKAIPGVFKIMAHYYGSSSPELFGPVTLHVDIFTNYGRKDQKRESITLRLAKEEEIVAVGEIKF